MPSAKAISEVLWLIPLMDAFQMECSLEMGLDRWYELTQRSINDLKHIFLICIRRRRKRDARRSLKELRAIWDELFTPQDKVWVERAIKILDTMRFRIKARGSKAYLNWGLDCLDRDKWTCTECGSKKTLHVHHRKQYRDYPQLRINVDNGVTLCQPCHKKEHNGIETIN